MSTKSACSSSSSLSAGRWLPDVRLVSPKLFANHVKVCTETNCAECIWAKKGAKWRKRFPWLRGGYKPSGDFGLGCTFCAQSAVKNKAGRQELADFPSRFDSFTMVPDGNTKNFAFQQHGQSPSHVSAQNDIQKDVENERYAPGADEFEKLINDMSRGQSAREQSGGTSSKRATLMRFSLAEGILDVYREFLSTSTSITLLRDVTWLRVWNFFGAKTFLLVIRFCNIDFLNCELNTTVLVQGASWTPSGSF